VLENLIPILRISFFVPLYRITMFKKIILPFTLFLIHGASIAQNDSIRVVNDIKDSLYILEFEERPGKPKLLHAEPLYIDLIRDLGARKGENEWNVGLGMTDYNRYDLYTALVEYEFAPIDRLGLEVELPFSFYSPLNGYTDSVPSSKLNSIKLAAQYTFLVHEKSKVSAAIGYIHEFEMNSFSDYNSQVFDGNLFNPFAVVAKRWGQNFHTLIYAGPMISKHFSSDQIHGHMNINTNFHYMIPGTRNFIGVEFNKDFYSDDFDMVIRPQMRVSVSDNLLVGIVTGIPVQRETQRFSTFLRLIYEPKHKH
jgi:hypothetical protein